MGNLGTEPKCRPKSERWLAAFESGSGACEAAALNLAGGVDAAFRAGAALPVQMRTGYPLWGAIAEASMGAYILSNVRASCDVKATTLLLHAEASVLRAGREGDH